MMGKHDEFIIEPRGAGQWAVKKPHAEHASTIEDSYKDAVKYAKEHAPEGDIKAKGLNGKFHHIQRGK
jgi:Uncharacterized protein conserved in bacteria (DUF2188)